MKTETKTDQYRAICAYATANPATKYTVIAADLGISRMIVCRALEARGLSRLRGRKIVLKRV